jgi:hypothetical protein
MLRVQCINTDLPFSTSLTAFDILPIESPIDLTTQDTEKRRTHHQLTPHQHNTETITMSQTQQPFSAAARLRQLLSDSNHTVVAPGVYDGISARLALAQGFECLYMVRRICGNSPLSYDEIDILIALMSQTYGPLTIQYNRPAPEPQCHASAWLISASQLSPTCTKTPP